LRGQRQPHGRNNTAQVLARKVELSNKSFHDPRQKLHVCATSFQTVQTCAIAAAQKFRLLGVKNPQTACFPSLSDKSANASLVRLENASS
jgi:hypothetical protein